MKKMVYVLIVIVLIALGIVVAVNLRNGNKEIPSSSENVENDKINNAQNNITNNAQNNITEEDTTINGENQEQDKNNNEEGLKTDLEKAIDIVKKDWGEDSSVYFAEDGQTRDGEYVICVRDNNTTSAIAWYTVDIKTGKFTKE